MAISLQTWLQWAGKDKRWYDSLRPDLRQRVDDSVKNTSPDRSRQSTSFHSVADIAGEIDQAASLPVPRTDSETQAANLAAYEADVRQNPEVQKGFIEFLGSLSSGTGRTGSPKYLGEAFTYSDYLAAPVATRQRLAELYHKATNPGVVGSNPVAIRQQAAAAITTARTGGTTQATPTTAASPSPTATPTTGTDAAASGAAAPKMVPMRDAITGEMTMVPEVKYQESDPYGLGPAPAGSGVQFFGDTYFIRRLQPGGAPIRHRVPTGNGGTEFVDSETPDQPQMMEVNQFLNVTTHWSEAKRRHWGQKLRDAGFDVPLGTPLAEQMQQPLATVIRYAQRHKMTLNEALSDFQLAHTTNQAAQDAADAEAKAKAEAEQLAKMIPAFRPVDKATVDSEANAFAQQSIGRDFTATERKRFAEQYRALEKRIYDENVAAIKAQFHGGGQGDVVTQTTGQGVQQMLEQRLIEGRNKLQLEATGNRMGQIAEIMARAVGGFSG